MMKGVKKSKMLDVVGLDGEEVKAFVPSEAKRQFKASCVKKGVSMEERLQYLIYADGLGLIDDDKIQSMLMSGLNRMIGHAQK